MRYLYRVFVTVQVAASASVLTQWSHTQQSGRGRLSVWWNGSTARNGVLWFLTVRSYSPYKFSAVSVYLG